MKITILSKIQTSKEGPTERGWPEKSCEIVAFNALSIEFAASSNEIKTKSSPRIFKKSLNHRKK